AALGLARAPPRVAGLTMSLFTLPVMVPPLVLGVGLLTYFTSVGIKLGLSTVIMSHLIFTQPFVMLIVYARMVRFDYAIVNSARDLGASPLRVFFTIVLPITRPTVIGAALIAMALSLDDFIITFFTIGGGNTLPTFLWGMLRKVITPQINVVAVVIMAITITVSLIALRVSRYRG
ncbi:MAG: ABC transporter permease subunit, partial [Proteobacteria bacterium]|nr:ABC transporter permease subunit [Pseudomonadota bacterium]